MAGSTANNTRSPSFLHQRRLPPKMRMPLLVRSSITINGRKFTTTIHEGASAEDLIAKVAKENGGGVARVYYPEFKTFEMVAVKIGDQLIVKGDPKRIQNADFSEFKDSASVKRAAIRASLSSKGGIHLFVGSDGIPMAAAKDESIVFPNAEELRVSTNINNLSLSVVDYNADPQNLSDVNRLYGQGARLSQDAKEEIEKSHGGVRSEKLMLPDTSVLILSRDSGDIRTASEFASRFKTEGFGFRPPIPQEFFSPQPVQNGNPVHNGLNLPTDLGVMHIPLDGSASKVPYLCVKVFDGRIADSIKVTMHTPQQSDVQVHEEAAPPAEQMPILVTEPKFNTELQEVGPNPVTRHAHLPKTETIMAAFRAPRFEQKTLLPPIRVFSKEQPVVHKTTTLPLKENPRLEPPLEKPLAKTPKPIAAAKRPIASTRPQKKQSIRTGSKQRTVRRKQQEKTPEIPAPKKSKKKTNTKPQKKSSLKKPRPKPSKPKKSKPKPARSPRPKKPRAKPRAAKIKSGPLRPSAKKAKKTIKQKTPKARSRKKPKQSLKPKPDKQKSRQVRKSRVSKKTRAVVLSSVTITGTKKAKKKSRKKKMSPYYYNQMLGLVKRKRSGARSSGRRKARSRT